MSKLKQRINDDIKSAMRNKDKQRLSALRLLAAACKQKEVDERIELDDAAVLKLVDKMAKQIRESIEQFSRAGREELVAKETFELEVIQQYLPPPLTENEIKNTIGAAIQETGAKSLKDMGKLMAFLKPSLQGRADMKYVSALVREQLN